MQTLDYYPYGATRVSGGVDAFARKYIGQFADISGLDYLNARYYSPSQGQFISQDPVFWEIGQTNTGKFILSNPQLLNSYSYAADNPITGKDADGKLVELVSRPIGDVPELGFQNPLLGRTLILSMCQSAPTSALPRCSQGGGRSSRASLVLATQDRQPPQTNPLPSPNPTPYQPDGFPHP